MRLVLVVDMDMDMGMGMGGRGEMLGGGLVGMGGVLFV